MLAGNAQNARRSSSQGYNNQAHASGSNANNYAMSNTGSNFV